MGLGPRFFMSNEPPGDTVRPLFVVKGWPAGLYSLASNSLFFFTHCLVVLPYSVTEIASVANDLICSLSSRAVSVTGKSTGLETAWVQTVALPFTSSVTSLCLDTLVFGKRGRS